MAGVVVLVKTSPTEFNTPTCDMPSQSPANSAPVTHFYACLATAQEGSGDLGYDEGGEDVKLFRNHPKFVIFSGDF